MGCPGTKGICSSCLRCRGRRFSILLSASLAKLIEEAHRCPIRIAISPASTASSLLFSPVASKSFLLPKAFPTRPLVAPPAVRRESRGVLHPALPVAIPVAVAPPIRRPARPARRKHSCHSNPAETDPSIVGTISASKRAAVVRVIEKGGRHGQRFSRRNSGHGAVSRSLHSSGLPQ